MSRSGGRRRAPRLQTRVLVLIGVAVVVPFVTLGAASWVSLRALADELLRERGRLAISVDKIDLTDRLRLRVEGGGVSVAEVRANLFAAYPELPHNLSIGNIRLDIETDAWLNDQFKAVRIVDRRESV